MIIREALESDLENVMLVERMAFGSEEEAKLVRNLLGDVSAAPVVSLLAFLEDRAVGHILFTRATLEPEAKLSISILAPLAVVPDNQKQGIGGKLIKYGLKILSESGVDLVFVLGHPEYYPRHGFTPAGKFGFEATYPIPEIKADAWMVQALQPNAINTFCGKVICADMMNRPEYWRE
ncbi:N-acetyltransferase [bacterium]|nr:N-acetyltransferase [bacterium]